MSPAEQLDFFVSYTSADRPWAEWIASVLEEAGYTVRIQAWDFAAGANFVLEMDEATHISQRTIACCRRRSLSPSMSSLSGRQRFGSIPWEKGAGC